MANTGGDDFVGGLQRGEMAADNFFIMSNAAARDPELHLADRGLLADMMSHKNGFVITEASLAARCKDGVKAVRECLKNLRARGYVYRGERTRYPSGSVNKKGKSISGALGPYRWYVTDKPAEIAVILTRYALEQRAINLAAEHIIAGQDYRPEWDVVPAGDDADPVDNCDLAAETAGSPDLGKQGESAGEDKRPFTTVLKGRTKEDQREEDQVEEQARGAASGAEPAALRLAGPDKSAAASVGGSLGPEFVDQPQTARARGEDRHRWDGIGGMIGNESPAAQRARTEIVTGRRAPSWAKTQEFRQKLDPAQRQAVRSELAQRTAGLPRATGLPVPDEQREDGPTPPD